MENKLADGILTVCKLLNKHSVQYIIVGGAAVALHGYFRQSVNFGGTAIEIPDLDFWYNPTYENYFKLLNALEELGQDVREFKEEQAPNSKKSFFRYQFENFAADFLPGLKAPLIFRSCFDNRDVVTLEGVNISFINYSDLITDKQANSRPKDIVDIEQLELKKRKND